MTLEDCLKSAERNVRALSGILDSLTTTGGSDPIDRLVFQDCMAIDIVAKAIDQVAPLAAARSQVLEIGEMSGLPPFVADEIRLIRVLVNLLGNAVKFSPEGGHILVEAKIKENNRRKSIVFSVKDDGIGIKEKDVQRIFEKGVSIADSNASSTGLGLFICKELVEAHGGRILVRSKKGEGSLFGFSISTSLQHQGNILLSL